MSTPLKNAIVWVDLEMTGLDIEKDVIIEIAVIVTDGELNIIKEVRYLSLNRFYYLFPYLLGSIHCNPPIGRYYQWDE